MDFEHMIDNLWKKGSLLGQKYEELQNYVRTEFDRLEKERLEKDRLEKEERTEKERADREQEERTAIREKTC